MRALLAGIASVEALRIPARQFSGMGLRQLDVQRGIRDRITPRSCRWCQASSRDAGKRWQQHWRMHRTRA